jgi:hypothetical protein
MLMRIFNIAPDVKVLVNGHRRKYHFNSPFISKQEGVNNFKDINGLSAGNYKTS